MGNFTKIAHSKILEKTELKVGQWSFFLCLIEYLEMREKLDIWGIFSQFELLAKPAWWLAPSF